MMPDDSMYRFMRNFDERDIAKIEFDDGSVYHDWLRAAFYKEFVVITFSKVVDEWERDGKTKVRRAYEIEITEQGRTWKQFKDL